MDLTNKIIDKVWNKADIVPFESPALYRRDRNGRVIYRFGYALRSGRGWDVSRILSASGEFQDDLDHLEPLHWESLLEKGEETTPTPPIAKLG